MSQHSIIEHRANYYFLKIEEDYLHICNGDHCKAAILSILEQWINEKRSKGKDLYVYMTYPQWIESMYGLYGRSYIMERLTQLEEEGLIAKRAYRLYGRLDTFEYTLIVPAIQEKLRGLPEKAPHETRPNLDGYKNGRVQNYTRPNLNASPVQKQTGNGSKNGRNIESITQNPHIDHQESNCVEKDCAHPPLSQDATAFATPPPVSVPEEKEKEKPTPTPSQPPEQKNHLPQASDMTPNEKDMLPAALVPPPKPARKPKVAKEDVPSPERIEAVFVCMDTTIRRLTKQEDFTFGRTKKAREAIRDLLSGRSVSPEKLDWHITRLWNKPKDERSGFYWRENLSVVAICNNYDREIVNYKPPLHVVPPTTPAEPPIDKSKIFSMKPLFHLAPKPPLRRFAQAQKAEVAP